jgi:hypothetical protein
MIMMLMLSSAWLFACDLCGYGSSGNYVGIMPEFQKNIAGIRYRNNSFKTHIGQNNSETYLTRKESFSTMEIWGSFRVIKKVQLLFGLPYQNNAFSNKTGKTVMNGIGDANISGLYTVFSLNKLTKQNRAFYQMVHLTGGMKIPTGKYTASADLSSGNLFSIGTGSLDWNAGLIYEMKLQRTGFNLGVNYKMNSSNHDHYRYGNKLQSSFQLYRKIDLSEKATLSPNIGISAENNDEDSHNGFDVYNSGGYVTNASFGMEMKLNRILLGFNKQLPMQQSIARNTIYAYARNMIHLSFTY